MAERRRIGDVEAHTRAFVRGLGELSARDQVTAAAAVTLAKTIDLEGDGSKLATLSRELRQLTGLLLPRVAGAAAPAVPVDEPRQDPVQAAIDQLAARRALRPA
jgi:hypothetical protein